MKEIFPRIECFDYFSLPIKSLFSSIPCEIFEHYFI